MDLSFSDPADLSVLSTTSEERDRHATHTDELTLLDVNYGRSIFSFFQMIKLLSFNTKLASQTSRNYILGP